MNHERIKKLTNEIQYLERQLAKELGYTTAPSMRREYQKWIERVQANKAGFLTVKAWKHAQEKK